MTDIIYHDEGGWTVSQTQADSLPGDRRLRVRNSDWPEGDHFVLLFNHLGGHLRMLDSAARRGYDIASPAATYPIAAGDVAALRSVIRAALPAWVAAATAADWRAVPASEVFATVGALARLGIKVPDLDDSEAGA